MSGWAFEQSITGQGRGSFYIQSSGRTLKVSFGEKLPQCTVFNI